MLIVINPQVLRLKGLRITEYIANCKKKKKKGSPGAPDYLQQPLLGHIEPRN